MKIKIFQIGDDKGEAISALIEEYCKFLRAFCDLTMENFKNEEALLKQIKKDDFMIVLDEKGRKMDSKNFARQIEWLKDYGKKTVFVIGGPFGLSMFIKEKAHLILSFSDMTFTHQLMRPLLLEQIYRAFCIINKKPYHHE